MSQQESFLKPGCLFVTHEHILLIAMCPVTPSASPGILKREPPPLDRLKQGDKEGRNPLLMKAGEKIIHLLGGWQQEKQKQEKVNHTKGLVYSDRAINS